jgi:carbamoyl-phosphate synthase small subunit
LVLEDGTVFEGESFGFRAPAFGEVVFSTGMCGYQESLTDPSFRGQILVMTYPLIGNYGTDSPFCQSDMVHARALVVREACAEPSPAYGGRTISDFLIEHKVPGISGVDTRALVIKIRTMGTMRGAITEDADSIEDLIKRIRGTPAPSEGNLVGEVSRREVEELSFGRGVRVGLLDCGAKSGILRDLSSRFDVTVFPYDAPADAIAESGVRGLLISNGPGDPSHPAVTSTAARTVEYLSDRLPLFGICFGNQVTALALGGSTYKLKFGHRGCNQPVKHEGRVLITSQNHGFAVDEASLEGTGLVADQFNVNDGTVEGMRHESLPIFTCQYHPEASPGPWDSSFLFDRFAKAVREARL